VQGAKGDSVGLDVGTAGLVPLDVRCLNPDRNASNPKIKAAHSAAVFPVVLLRPVVTINRLPQDSTGFEGQHLPGLDGYLLPGLGITAASGRLRLDHEIAESRYFDVFPTLQGGFQGVEKTLDRLAGVFFSHACRILNPLHDIGFRHGYSGGFFTDMPVFVCFGSNYAD